MRFPRLLTRAALALTLTATIVAPARADVVSENATLNYSPGSKTWDFQTPFVSGYIDITSKGLGKSLTKLKATGPVHSCVLTYDNDSKMSAGNGNFYPVYKLSKCD